MAGVAMKHFIKSVYDLAKFLEPYHNFPEEKQIKQTNERILKQKDKENFAEVEVKPLEKWKEMWMEVMANSAKDRVLFIIQGKWYLTTKFIEYIKERIKVEKEVNENYVKA